MYTISPIGSCRITSPLRSGQNRHGIKLNLQRCYGYCHSPAEAVQLARFMHGDHAIPKDIWPLICRSHDYDAITAQSHDPSDLYVIELASAKELTIDGVSVQLNYLRQAFPEFFEDEARLLQFWELAASEGQSATTDFLREHWSADEKQAQDTAVLSRLELKFSDRESLRENVSQLAELLPDVVFVSHVDALKTDGKPIPSRSKFIKMVQDEVTDLGLKFYDPTELMQEFGQGSAIEDDSTSLAHFTDEFGDAVMDQWMGQFVEPSTDAQALSHGATADRFLVPQIDAAIKQGKLAATLVRLERLAPENTIAKSASHRLAERLLDAQDKLKSVASDVDFPIASAEADRMVAKAAQLGLFDLALELMLQSKGGMQAFSAHRLIELAREAVMAGDDTNAFEFALAAFQKSALPRAKSLLIEVSLKARLNLLGEVEPDQWPNLLSGLTIAQRLTLLKLAEVAPSETMTKDWTPNEVVEFASLVSEDGNFDEATRIVRNWQAFQNGDRIKDQTVADLVDAWCASALKITNHADRIHAIAHLLTQFPKQRSLMDAARDERRALMDRIRAAGKDDDLDAVLAMQAEADALPNPLPDFELWKARLYFYRKDYAEVLKFAPYAAETMNDRIGVWVMLMRSARQLGDDRQSTAFAQRVIELAGPDDAKLRAEAEAVADFQTAVGA